MNDNISELKEAEKDAEEETAELQGNDNSGMVWGLILVGMGIIFLLSNLNVIPLVTWNWWAFFILIPAISGLNNAWQAYQRDGSLSHDARGSLTWSSILLLVAATFLFDWSWGAIWPVFIIIIGISSLLGAKWGD